MIPCIAMGLGKLIKGLNFSVEKKEMNYLKKEIEDFLRLLIEEVDNLAWMLMFF